MMAVYVSWLVDAARAAAAGTGKQVIVSAGWSTRGHGGMRVVEGVVGHHTGTPESAPGDYPTLGVVRDGRAGLAGPLAHCGLGRSGNIYVIAAGLCYHAGASAFAGFTDLNDEFIGIEAEDSGDGVWTDAQLNMYPRLVRACLDYMRRGVDRYASHRTVAVPAGRKNDPAGISDQWMRDRATTAFAGNQEDNMPLTDADIERTWRWPVDDFTQEPKDGKYPTMAAYLALSRARQDAFAANVRASQADAEVRELKAEVGDLKTAVASLAVGNLPPEQIEAALRRVLGETTGKVTYTTVGGEATQ